MLSRHYSTYGNKWADISRAMSNCSLPACNRKSPKLHNGRSRQQVLIRWTNQLKPGISKNSWGEEEDRALHDLKAKGGSWTKVAADLGIGRTPKQCQERWTNVLDPARNVADCANWSKEEDLLLIQIHNELHGKMAQIQLRLPGSCFNDCQKRYWILHQDQAPKKKTICKHNLPMCTYAQKMPWIRHLRASRYRITKTRNCSEIRRDSFHFVAWPYNCRH